MRKDKQKDREYQRAWRANNRARVNAQQRLWRLRNHEQALEHQRRYRAKHREESRQRCRDWWHNGGKFKHEERAIQRKYGITIEQREALFQAQNGKCAICGDPLAPWKQFTKAKNAIAQIDHDHITGIVRGLLCGFCNRGIAHFKDDLSRLANAVTYLKKHGRS